MSDTDVSANLAGWVSELELKDISKRLHDIYTYLSQLDTYLHSTVHQITKRLVVNSRNLGEAIIEMIDQVQRQDALDIGDPDINEEVVGTLHNMLVNISAINMTKSKKMAIVEIDEIQEAIADLAEYVANY